MLSLRVRCNVVTGVFVAIVAISAIAALSGLSLVQYLQAVASGVPADEARAERIDARQAVIGIIQVVLFLSCAVVFLMWFHRAHKNLKLGGLQDLQYSPGWAVGGFFVPFLNLVRPFQVMQEAWKGSKFLSGDVEAESWKQVPVDAHVGWWWALFIAQSLLGNVSGRLMLHAEELGEYLTAGWVMLASDLLEIPAALVALFLVRRVTDLQERARPRLQASESPADSSISLE